MPEENVYYPQMLFPQWANCLNPHSFIYLHMAPTLYWVPGLHNIIRHDLYSPTFLFWTDDFKPLWSSDSGYIAGHSLNVLYVFLTWVKDRRHILAGVSREDTGAPGGSEHPWRARKIMGTTKNKGKWLGENVESECRVGILSRTHLSRS